jgi:hypothetical protein
MSSRGLTSNGSEGHSDATKHHKAKASTHGHIKEQQDRDHQSLPRLKTRNLSFRLVASWRLLCLMFLGLLDQLLSQVLYHA